VSHSDFVDPADCARSVRERFAVGMNSPLPDILRLIEVDAGVNVVVAPLPEGGPAGIYALERSTPFILVNGSDHVVRQRFTLAHEFGHHELGHGEAWDQVIDQHSRDPRESAANRFAAELLAPESAVRRWHQTKGSPEVDLELIVRLADNFGVSCPVARYRAESAGILRGVQRARLLDAAIRDQEHLILKRQMLLTPLQDSLSAVPKGETRLPRRMTENLLSAYQHGLMNDEQLADRLRLDTSYVRRFLTEAGLDRAEDYL
jgi:Zn-dependent peptidase ImmA (M78 family)